MRIVLLMTCLLLGTSGVLQGCESQKEKPTNLTNRSINEDTKIRVEAVIEEVNVASQALQQDMTVSIYIPPNYNQKEQYPVLYLLYGYGGNHASWFNQLHINQAADQLINSGQIKPLIIVSPDYGNSFGVNTSTKEVHPSGVDTGNYEDYLINDLVPYVDEHYSTLSSKQGRYIGGASMGGYAALYLGFNHAELFSKIGAHSAALWDYSDSDHFINQRDWLYATPELREKRDPFRLAQSAKNDLEIYLDAGEQDPLAEKAISLYELLITQDIDAEWHTHTGNHTMTYWSDQSVHYLLFYAGK